MPQLRRCRRYRRHEAEAEANNFKRFSMPVVSKDLIKEGRRAKRPPRGGTTPGSAWVDVLRLRAAVQQRRLGVDFDFGPQVQAVISACQLEDSRAHPCGLYRFLFSASFRLRVD